MDKKLKESLKECGIILEDEKECLKFTVYVFPPKGKTTDLSWIKRLVNYPRNGRVQVYDEFNKRKGKMLAFGNFQELCEVFETEFKTRVKKLMKSWR